MTSHREAASSAGAEARSETEIAAAVSPAEADEIAQFLFKEARLADESRYLEWESLVDDDMVYWVPRGEGDFDPHRHVSITYDNRRRLANRIKQLDTGRRLSQKPASPMRRVLSNLEITRTAGGEYTASCNFVLYELQIQATNALQVWPGRIEYRLRRRNGGLAMFLKKVMLVNGSGPVPSIAFLL